MNSPRKPRDTTIHSKFTPNRALRALKEQQSPRTPQSGGKNTKSRKISPKNDTLVLNLNSIRAKLVERKPSPKKKGERSGSVPGSAFSAQSTGVRSLWLKTSLDNRRAASPPRRISAWRPEGAQRSHSVMVRPKIERYESKDPVILKKEEPRVIELAVQRKSPAKNEAQVAIEEKKVAVEEKKAGAEEKVRKVKKARRRSPEKRKSEERAKSPVVRDASPAKKGERASRSPTRTASPRRGENGGYARVESPKRGDGRGYSSALSPGRGERIGNASPRREKSRSSVTRSPTRGESGRYETVRTASPTRADAGRSPSKKSPVVRKRSPLPFETNRLLDGRSRSRAGRVVVYRPQERPVFEEACIEERRENSEVDKAEIPMTESAISAAQNEGELEESAVKAKVGVEEKAQTEEHGKERRGREREKSPKQETKGRVNSESPPKKALAGKGTKSPRKAKKKDNKEMVATGKKTAKESLSIVVTHNLERNETNQPKDRKMVIQVTQEFTEKPEKEISVSPVSVNDGSTLSIQLTQDFEEPSVSEENISPEKDEKALSIEVTQNFEESHKDPVTVVVEAPLPVEPATVPVTALVEEKLEPVDVSVEDAVQGTERLEPVDVPVTTPAPVEERLEPQVVPVEAPLQGENVEQVPPSKLPERSLTPEPDHLPILLNQVSRLPKTDRNEKPLLVLAEAAPPPRYTPPPKPARFSPSRNVRSPKSPQPRRQRGVAKSQPAAKERLELKVVDTPPATTQHEPESEWVPVQTLEVPSPIKLVGEPILLQRKEVLSRCASPPSRIPTRQRPASSSETDLYQLQFDGSRETVNHEMTPQPRSKSVEALEYLQPSKSATPEKRKSKLPVRTGRSPSAESRGKEAKKPLQERVEKPTPGSVEAPAEERLSKDEPKESTPQRERRHIEFIITPEQETWTAVPVNQPYVDDELEKFLASIGNDYKQPATPEDFEPPTDFTKKCRFPRGFLEERFRFLEEEDEAERNRGGEPDAKEAMASQAEDEGQRGDGLDDEFDQEFSDSPEEETLQEQSDSEETGDSYQEQSDHDDEEEQGQEEKDTEEDTSLQEQRASHSSFRSKGGSTSSEDTDDFLDLENQMMEEQEELVDNFDIVGVCVHKKCEDRTKKRQILDAMREHKGSHFVALLREQTMTIQGVYLLDLDANKAMKLWGNTPDELDGTEELKYWTYQVTKNEFIPQSELGFTPLTDAVSMNL